ASRLSLMKGRAIGLVVCEFRQPTTGLAGRGMIIPEVGPHNGLSRCIPRRHGSESRFRDTGSGPESGACRGGRAGPSALSSGIGRGPLERGSLGAARPELLLTRRRGGSRG